SGYVSNQTGISTIAKLLPNCLILSDAWNHNSMIEGVRQAGTEKQIWRHNDVKHLEELLAAQPRERPKLIVFEGLYSLDGYIAASRNIVDAVRSYAPGFIFTTALPPAVCAGVTAAIRHLKESDWERERHQDRAARTKSVLHAAGLPVMHSDTHIVPLFVGDPEKCKQASDLLLADHGIYIQPINYPTVPRGTERLRITPSPYHEDALID